jgi:hypothetical protein
MNIDEGLRRLVIGIFGAAFLLGTVVLIATDNLVLGIAVAVTVVAVFFIALYVANGFLKKDSDTKDTS